MAPYQYTLPTDRIAQRPIQPYHEAKMLVIQRSNYEFKDSKFAEFSQYWSPCDLIVFNDSRVIPARLFGSFLREGQSGGEVEVLLIEKQSSEDLWRVLGRPMKKFRPGTQVVFNESLRGEVIEKLGDEEASMRFFTVDSSGILPAIFEHGRMPIPPYIRDGLGDLKDRDDYQSMFAKVDGSIAAPTASLHFTPTVLANLEAKGVNYTTLTLHVGVSSIRPLQRQGDSLSAPGAEQFSCDQELVQRIRATKAKGGRVVAVGTTVVRALETQARIEAGEIPRNAHATDLFITPGFDFRWVDAMVTNFHQPGTTHLLLVEAFMGRELLERAYQHALEEDYRFLSYGDGMVIL